MQLPDKFGKYEVQGIIGRGGAGTVYLGRDPVLARSVAIKVIPLEIVDDYGREQYARFKREAQAVGRMQHGHIVAVYDYGETDRHAYIVMELLEGGSLKARMEQGRSLPLAEVERIMQGLLDALRHSHQNGVVHRDIKPANVVFNKAGDPKITDFGIARLDSGAMTVLGATLGTPAYMSPEQVNGDTADARSDLYSAGVMLFEMLSGRKPFEGSAVSVMHKIIAAPVPPLTELPPPVRREFDAFLGRAMAKAADDRFQSAADMWQALKAAFGGSQPTGGGLRARRPGLDPPPRDRATARRGTANWRTLPLAAGALVAVTLLGGGVWLLLTPPSQPPMPGSDGAAAAAPAAGWRRTAAAIVATAPCSLLRSNVSAAGEVVVSGLTGLAEMSVAEVSATLRRAMTQEFPLTSLSWRATHVDGPYCSVLSAYRQFVARADETVLGLTVSPSPAGPQLRVAMAGRAPTLLVDRFMADGKVAHLRRDDASSPERAADPIPLSGTATPSGAADVVVVLAASGALSLAPRAGQEGTAGYLAELHAAVERAQQSGVDVIAAAITASPSRR